MSEYQNFLIHHNLDSSAENKKKRYKKIKRLDTRHILEDPTEIRLFCYCRDELERLPFFLEYYRKLGVRRFFFLDNASKDETSAYLLKQPDVHLFFSNDSFSESKGGLFWIEFLVGKYGLGYWCLVADVDEFFCFDQCEEKKLQDLRDVLEVERSEAFQVMLLDMYAKTSVDSSHYQAGQNPLEVCAYYDADTHYDGGFFMDASTREVHCRKLGGVRRRIFNFSPCLTKIPFFKFTSNMRLHRGCHRLWGAKLSKLQGVMMHFKFFSTFFKQVQRAVEEKNYWKESKEYFLYCEKLQANSGISFYDGDKSRKYKSMHSLREVGLLTQIPFSDAEDARKVRENDIADSFGKTTFSKTTTEKLKQQRICFSAVYPRSTENLRMKAGFFETKYFFDHAGKHLFQQPFFKRGMILILTCDLPLFSRFYARNNFLPAMKLQAEVAECWLSAHLSFIEATSFLPATKNYYARIEDLNELSEKKLLTWLSVPLLKEFKKMLIDDKGSDQYIKNPFCIDSLMANYPEIKSLRKIFGYLDKELTPELQWIK